MSSSVFLAVPGLETAVESGTRQNVQIEEHRCEPGDIHKYSGIYENILSEIRMDLFRINSPVDKEIAEKLLLEARNHFYKNSH